MNRYFSILELHLRQKLKYEIAGMVLLFIVEVLMFNMLGSGSTFAENFESAHIALAVLAGYMITFVVIIGNNKKGAVPKDMRVGLLRVSKRTYWYMESIANFLIMLIFYLVQIIIFVFLMIQFSSKGVDPAGDIGVFTDIYKVRYVYGFMPIGSPVLLVSNILYMAAVAMGTALIKLPGASRGIIWVALFSCITPTLFISGSIYDVENVIGMIVKVFVLLVIILLLNISSCLKTHGDEMEASYGSK